MSKKEVGVPSLTIDEINTIVCQLIDLYKTSSPFVMCERMGINVMTLDLPLTIEGFFVNSEEVDDRNYMSIIINESVPENRREKVCAHELGHVVLHCNINAEKFTSSQNIYLESLEFEADLFSLILLEKNSQRKTGTDLWK